MSVNGQSRSTARILALANQKGGVGKTTTAINLGTGLAQAGKKCVIIDLDPQGNASTGLGFRTEDRLQTTYDALGGSTPLVQVLSPTTIEGLSIAPASVDLSGIDVELVDDPQRARKLKTLIDDPAGQMTSRFDYILIDCPPSLNLLTINAMAAADGILVPLQCEFFALEGLTQLIGTVQRVQGALNPGLRISGIILTMYDQRNRLSSQVADDVRENLGDIVFSTLIPRNVRLSEAPSFGLPVMAYDADCAGSLAYKALTKELLSRDSETLAA
ncbi:MAG: ParA family protein [Pseudomonadota bacterium]